MLVSPCLLALADGACCRECVCLWADDTDGQNPHQETRCCDEAAAFLRCTLLELGCVRMSAYAPIR